MSLCGQRVDLHLQIECDRADTVEIELHGEPGVDGARLDCRRSSYEEIGGESFHARRQQSRHRLDQASLETLQRLLSNVSSLPGSQPEIAIDGVTVTLTIGRGVDAREYLWSPPAPAGWEGLGEIVYILVAAAGIAEDQRSDQGMQPSPRPKAW